MLCKDEVFIITILYYLALKRRSKFKRGANKEKTQEFSFVVVLRFVLIVWTQSARLLLHSTINRDESSEMNKEKVFHMC